MIVFSRVLGSGEPLSTDEDSSSDDEDLNEMADHLDGFLHSKKSASQVIN